MKITEYPTAQFLDEGDVLIKDGTNGTKQIKGSDLVYALFDGIPEMHNQIYRGKNLGTVYKSDQQNAINDGTFHDLWIGDYWEIGSYTYRIAAFDWFYGMGYNPKTTTHHVVIVPDESMGNSVFADSNDRFYADAKVRTIFIPSISPTINSAFGNRILSHRVDLQSGSAENNVECTIASQWYDGTIELMTPSMIIAGASKSEHFGKTLKSYGECLPLFILKPELVSIDTAYWTQICDWRLPKEYKNFVSNSGMVEGDLNTASKGVRPYFLIY